MEGNPLDRQTRQGSRAAMIWRGLDRGACRGFQTRWTAVWRENALVSIEGRSTLEDPTLGPGEKSPGAIWPPADAHRATETFFAHEALRARETVRAQGAPRAQDRGVANLKRAMRRARLDEAERTEVIAELRGAEIARLEMLQEALAPLLAEVPPNIDLFDVAIMPGAHARLFIDMIGFVEMTNDRRCYRFVQDTRHGRTVLAESERIDAMVDAITDYMAHRLLEREKALASDVRFDPAARLRQAARGDATAVKTTQKNLDPAGTQWRVAGWEAAFSRAMLAILSFLIEVLGSAAFFMLLAIGGWYGWKTLAAWGGAN